MEHKTCPFCGHTWIPRTDNPVRCPCCVKSIAIRKGTGINAAKQPIPVLVPTFPAGDKYA